MNKNDLLCPHCGGRAKMASTTVYAVICDRCRIASRDAHSEEKAISAWNAEDFEYSVEAACRLANTYRRELLHLLQHGIAMPGDRPLPPELEELPWVQMVYNASPASRQKALELAWWDLVICSVEQYYGGDKP